jgi:hypothetical protein
MTLKRLLEVMPSPAHPIETVEASQWETFEVITGIALPDDYKDYFQVFGTGIIGGVVLPYSPFCTRPWWQVRYASRAWVPEALNIPAANWQFGVHPCPYAVYPEPDGVLPWGQTDNGDRLFWLRHGSPHDWHILVNEARSSSFEPCACSMTEWVCGWIPGALASTIMPYDALDQTHLFETIEQGGKRNNMRLESHDQ